MITDHEARKLAEEKDHPFQTVRERELARRLKEAEAREAVMVEALKEIRGVSCGETDVPELDVYSATDTDALAWVFHKSEEILSLASPRAKQILADTERYQNGLRAQKEGP
jgi:hypothetical protein